MQIALEEAKTRLHVTEAEASWWKVTAYIVSEHIVFYTGTVIVKRVTAGFRHMYSGHWRNKECVLMSWRESNTSSWRQEIYYFENVMYIWIKFKKKLHINESIFNSNITKV